MTQARARYRLRIRRQRRRPPFADCSVTVKLGDMASAENRSDLDGKKRSFPGVSFSTGF